MTYTIVVLNDGETYSDIIGCKILTITESAHNALCEGEPLSNILDNHILSSGLISRARAREEIDDAGNIL